MTIKEALFKWDLGGDFTHEQVEERVARMIDLQCQIGWRGDGLKDEEAKELDDLEEWFKSLTS